MHDAATAHTPVLLAEAVEALRVRPEGVYVDCTFGRGGHARAILARLGPAGRLVVMDRDPEAIAVARRLLGEDARVEILQGDFAALGARLAALGLTGRVDGLLLDLGVSSPQLETAGRGFSFMREGPLDMRMDPHSGAPAATWLAGAEEAELARVFAEFGEEPEARRVARALVQARREAPIETTSALAELVSRAKRRRERGLHPATRVFQAIRIHVNRELEALAAVLEAALAALAPAGRLVVVSFHSLEDRLVKRFFRAQAETLRYETPRSPFPVECVPGLRLVGRAVRPGEDEVAANPRARSAVMRVAERPA